MKPSVTVLGSGHSGHALSAAFAQAGFPVTLVSMRRAGQGLVDFSALNATMCVSQDAEITDVPMRYSNDLQQAMQADLVLCSMPALYHAEVVRRILPFVRSGQFIYFSSYFGASRMLAALHQRSDVFGVTVVESMSAIHAARSQTYGQVEILATKDAVPVATYPSYRSAQFIKIVQPALPNLIPAPTILATSLNNVGPILHVPLMLFNASRIESADKSTWNLYREGLTPAVIRFIKSLDQERLKIAHQLGVACYSLEEIMTTFFYKNKMTDNSDFWQWIRQNKIHASNTIGAPAAIETRYLTEGVYHGLVPLAKLAEDFGLSVPLIHSTIEMTNHLLGKSKLAIEACSYLTPSLVCDLKHIASAA